MTTTIKPLAERLLCFLLRYLGLVSMLALVAVFMPYTWMDATHRWLGLGTLPSEPVVGYLARSLSLFYALFGGLLWALSLHPRKYRAILLYVAGGFLFFGAVLLGVDYAEGMPSYWKHAEGPMVILLGGALLWLTTQLRPTDFDRGEASEPSPDHAG